jgi:hypothetical protein
MRYTSIILIWMALATVGWGRLYQSRRECDQRYHTRGKPFAHEARDKQNPLKLGTKLATVSYDYRGLEVRIGFLKDHAVCIEYTQVDNKDEAISDEVIDWILQASGGRRRRTWTLVPFDPEVEPAPEQAEVLKKIGPRSYWVRRDGSIAYLKDEAGRTLRLEHVTARE